MTFRALALGLIVAGFAPMTSAQQVVETFSGTATDLYNLPGTIDGGSVLFGSLTNFNTITFTPGSVTFEGQPVDFSGTEANWLANSFQSQLQFPVTAGPAITNPTGPAIAGGSHQAAGTRTIDQLNLGPGFSSNDLDVVNGSNFQSLTTYHYWNSVVVPELNGHNVIIELDANVTNVDPVAGFYDYAYTGTIFALPNDILFGPPVGTGCVITSPGDTLSGDPGMGFAIPNGVAQTATTATLTDSNNDGTVTAFCEATRDFTVELPLFAELGGSVFGDFSSPSTLTTTAEVLVELTPGGESVGFQNFFDNQSSGVFSGSATSPPIQINPTPNTLHASGSLQFSGPSGFDVDVSLPASIDGTLTPLPPLPSLNVPIAIGLATTLLASGGLVLRRRGQSHRR